MINILYATKLKSRMPASLFKKRVLHAMQLLNINELVVTIKLCDDEEMRELNQYYRGIDHTTDVLSFNMNYEDPGLDQIVLGDIIISLPTAIQQAEENHHAVEDEVTFLAIHGLLHLMGHDHASQDEEHAMFALQNSIYKQVLSGNDE